MGHKPGEQFTYQDEIYEVSEELPAGKACEVCEKEYGEHGKPCSWHDNFPCTIYCGMRCYPKIAKVCGNKDNT